MAAEAAEGVCCNRLGDGTLAIRDEHQRVPINVALIAAASHSRSWASNTDGRRIDEVERGLWQHLLTIGWAMLQALVADAGDGDVGETIEQNGEPLRRLDEPQARRYVSIFGALRTSAVCVRGPGKTAGQRPVGRAMGTAAGGLFLRADGWAAAGLRARERSPRPWPGWPRCWAWT